MAATADPRAKPAPAPSTRHLEPWGHQQQGPRAHRAHPVRHAVASASPMGGASGSDDTRDRRRSSSHHRGGAAQVVGEEEPYGGGIEELRVKLMGHLRDAANHLRVPQPSPLLPPPPKAVIPPPHTEEVEPEPEPEPELRAPPPPPPEPTQQPQVDVADRPWKLRERTRRRPAALTSWAGTAAPSSSSRRRRRATFSVSLVPEEIEEDIYALTGGRPRRRPRKRPRVVQRQLDSLFPGLWLTEITADAYRVQDDG